MVSGFINKEFNYFLLIISIYLENCIAETFALEQISLNE